MISIITITFNNYEELRATLNSIADVKDIQSIVINGGKCQETLAFLKTYPGISISEKDNGISDAFNKGIRLSTGDAIMFLNSGDILLEKKYIDHVNKLLNSNPEIAFFYSNIIYNDSLLGETKITVGHNDKPNLAKGMPYPHQSLIIRKSVFDKIGFFKTNLKIAMDFDVYLRMIQNNFTKFDYYTGYTVLMDGSGVSSTQQLKGIKEIHTILADASLLTLKRKLRLKISLALFYIKKIKFFNHLLKKYRYSKNKTITHD